MTSREQFEAWFKPRKERMKNDGIGTLNIVRYCSMAWAGWQASREAVEVELPEEMKAREALDKGFMCDYAAGVTDTVVQMRENLCAAGVKVKGE